MLKKKCFHQYFPSILAFESDVCDNFIDEEIDNDIFSMFDKDDILKDSSKKSGGKASSRSEPFDNYGIKYLFKFQNNHYLVYFCHFEL